jgi:hypothetical protein
MAHLLQHAFDARDVFGVVQFPELAAFGVNLNT